MFIYKNVCITYTYAKYNIYVIDSFFLKGGGMIKLSFRLVISLDEGGRQDEGGAVVEVFIIIFQFLILSGVFWGYCY